MKAVNVKLRNKIKELNAMVERAIDKANQKKLFAIKKEQDEQKDVAKLI